MLLHCVENALYYITRAANVSIFAEIVNDQTFEMQFEELYE